jgi:hypothetical protein
MWILTSALGNLEDRDVRLRGDSNSCSTLFSLQEPLRLVHNDSDRTEEASLQGILNGPVSAKTMKRGDKIFKKPELRGLSPLRKCTHRTTAACR